MDEAKDFEAMMSRFEGMGFEVMQAGGRCPYQIELNHPAGFYLYFRSRWQAATLAIFDRCCYDDGLPKEGLLWEGYLQAWQEPDAGWLDAGDAHYAFSALFRDALDVLDELRESIFFWS